MAGLCLIGIGFGLAIVFLCALFALIAKSRKETYAIYILAGMFCFLLICGLAAIAF